MRTVRGVDDELWVAAQAKARGQGLSVSSVIGQLLRQWVAQDEDAAGDGHEGKGARG